MELKENKFFWLTVYATAMGFLEAAVVVYLRKIYYPEGFNFPLVWVAKDIVIVEMVREFCTIAMIIAVAYLAGKNKWERFSYFIYVFAVWDIVYYLGLKGALNWPSSLLTWDILFLIPYPWAGPVLAPVLGSIAMIIISLLIVKLQKKNKKFNINFKEWTLLGLGSLIILLTVMYDYGRFLMEKEYFSKLYSMSHYEAANLIAEYVPKNYNWALFFIGIGIIALSMISIYRRNKK